MKKFFRRRLIEIKNTTMRAKDQIKDRIAETFNKNEGSASIGALLLIVLVVVIFAFIVFPQSRAFIDSMFTKMTNYVSSLPLFPTT